MYTLIIVDPLVMCLPSKNDRRGYAPLTNIQREIDTARRLEAKIVVVAYPKMGPLDPSIMRMLIGYSNVLIVEKTEWWGAREIIAECKAFGYALDHVRVCGFYTHRCVQETVRLLSNILHCRIDVVMDACDDYEGNRWSKFVRLPGITLV